jgi:hypothetical protein
MDELYPVGNHFDIKIILKRYVGSRIIIKHLKIPFQTEPGNIKNASINALLVNGLAQHDLKHN